MQTITVYQADAAGRFVGVTDAFESPLEPGVFHIPAGATAEPPPDRPWPDGTVPRLVGGVWVMQAPS